MEKALKKYGQAWKTNAKRPWVFRRLKKKVFLDDSR